MGDGEDNSCQLSAFILRGKVAKGLGMAIPLSYLEWEDHVNTASLVEAVAVFVFAATTIVMLVALSLGYSPLVEPIELFSVFVGLILAWRLLLQRPYMQKRFLKGLASAAFISVLLMLLLRFISVLSH